MTVDGLSDVLGYGDDPDVEPGETAVRAFTDRAGQPAETLQDDEKVLQTFEKARTARACWAGDRRCRPPRTRSGGAITFRDGPSGDATPVPVFGIDPPGVSARQAQLCRRKQAGPRQGFPVTYCRRRRSSPA